MLNHRGNTAFNFESKIIFANYAKAKLLLKGKRTTDRHVCLFSMKSDVRLFKENKRKMEKEINRNTHFPRNLFGNYPSPSPLLLVSTSSQPRLVIVSSSFQSHSIEVLFLPR